MDPAHRGLIVQQGGAKALIPLANNGNFVGKAIAAQALCKIAITQDPNITFPGQRVGFLDFYYRCKIVIVVIVIIIVVVIVIYIILSL